MYKSCFTKSGKFVPLHDLSDELLDKIYEKYKIEIPEIYKYVKSSGCMGCPYGIYKHDTVKELKLITKNQRKFLNWYFGESYRIRGIDIHEIMKECGDFSNINKER